jgi:MFS family permease
MRTSFWRMLSATGISKFGDGLILVGLPLYTASLTHGSVTAVASMAFVVRLPWLLLALPAGAHADRRPFRRTMVISDVARFVLVGALALVIALHLATLPILFLIGFALGAFDTTFCAAAANGLPAVVDDDELPRANGRMCAVESAGEQVVGPAAAGLLYSFGAAVPFVGDALSFLASAALLRKLPKGEAPIVADTYDGAGTTLRSDMRDGVRHFAHNRVVRVLTLLVATWSFAQSAVYAVQVLYVVKVLGLPPRMFGILLATTAIFNVVGGLLAERVWNALGTMRLLVFTGVAITLAFVVAARTSSPWVAAMCFAVEALATPAAIVATGTLRTRAVPAEMRGKVMNISRTMVIAAAAFGALAAGPIARSFGLRAPMYVGAGIFFAALVVAIRPLRSVLAQLPDGATAGDDDRAVDGASPPLVPAMA